MKKFRLQKVNSQTLCYSTPLQFISHCRLPDGEHRLIVRNWRGCGRKIGSDVILGTVPAFGGRHWYKPERTSGRTDCVMSEK